MSEQGKTDIVVKWVASTDEDVAEGDRIFASHAAWMQGHPRDGSTALLSYRISKGPELADPLDPTSEPTGNTIYVLHEVYESPDGVDEHWRLAKETWDELPAFMKWSVTCRASTLHYGTVVRALW